MSMNAAQYYAAGGIHRVPLWRIAGFALNSTATNLYLIMMTAASWYLMGPVGIGLTAATVLLVLLHLFDGITDPIAGFVVDRTSGKFGKNRPFMVLGNAAMLIGSFFMMNITDKLPANGILRFAFFLIFGIVFFIGYSFQTVVTRSAQACLTNDPSQRPAFGAFDVLFNTIMLAIVCMTAPALSKAEAGFFHTFWLAGAIISAVLTAAAVYSISVKDRPEFFGTGKRIVLSLKDFSDAMKNNQAIRVLMLTSATDRFAAAAHTAALSAAMFACLAGSEMLEFRAGVAVLIPGGILACILVMALVSRLGTQKSVILGSIGGIIVNLILAVLWGVGDPRTMTADAQTGSLNFSLFMIVFVSAGILRVVFSGFSSGIIAPMAGDCSDYEVYRTGKYIPAMIGAMLTTVDKLASALAPVLTGFLLAIVGFGGRMPSSGDASGTLRAIVVVLAYILPAAGLAVNVYVMRKYPLTKEYMAQIEEEISKVKEASYTRRF